MTTGLLGLLFASCTDQAPPDSVGLRTTPQEVVSEDGQLFRRDCESAIHIEDHDPSFGSSPDAVGPVKFLRISDEGPDVDADQLTPDEDGRLEGLKYVTVVSEDVPGPVRVSIAGPSRSHARLSYDPASWGRAPLQSGHVAVQLEPCVGGDTQYNGGFRVRGPRCVEVVVEVVDAPRRRWQRSLPFGQDCSDGLASGRE